jgi:alpha-L-rhamnosidase
MRRLAACLLLLAFEGYGQPPSRFWNAHWIDVPGASPHDYGVYHFRRTFELAAKPEHFPVRVSGDNRYELFVNGKRLAFGPARGDLTHWRYETVDIAPALEAGKNVLAAVVWNDGAFRAVAQVSNQTGFLLEGSGDVNTGSSWKCMVDAAYSPQPLPADQRTGYYALAANERFDASRYPWGWETAAFDDSAWPAAHEISPGAAREARDAPNRWMLVAREIPLEEQLLERMRTVRKAEGVTASETFLHSGQPLTIPAHTSALLLFDQGYLTTAYPELTVSGGAGASVDLAYAETLYIRKNVDKGNRNDVEGKQFYGPADTYLADGGAHRTYRPLFWRTYRYLELRVKTANQPLAIEDLHGTFTAFPFKKKAQFEVGDPAANEEIQQILGTGWRSARLCAHETYMDCPFYEQLQYAGDARIQMLVSLYTAGDARLMKNGIALIDSSRTAEGATNSRAPSYLQQYIPPFSLWWIGMVHDYWMYVDDEAFVKQMLPGVRAVLAFYAAYQKDDGSLRRMPWWNFVDWVKQWSNGESPAEADGSSAAALDLQLILAYQWARDLENTLGSKALSEEYQSAAGKLKATVLATDWDPARGLFADQPSHRTYSQQVNTLAVLARVPDREQSGLIMQRVLDNPSLAQSSIYFRAYTNAALREAGMGDKYLGSLGPWREMLKQGLTTWAEWNGPDARSDCHAWGASPNFELFRTVAGIEPIAPGFRRVRVAPHLGDLKHLAAHMPHPKGEILVDFTHENAHRLGGDVTLPSGVTGVLEWGGVSQPLHEGKNHFQMEGR